MNTQNIIRRLASGSVLRVFSLTCSAAVAFFMMPFLVHSLGERDYGIWVLVGTLVGYYGFLDMGLATAVGRFISKAFGTEDHEEINRVVSSSLLLFVGIGALIIVLSILMAQLSHLFVDDPSEVGVISTLIIILGISVGTQFPIRTFSGLLTSMVRFDLLVKIDLFKLLVRTGLIVYVITSGYGLVAMAWIMLACEISGNLLHLYFVRKHAPFVQIRRKFFNKDRVKDIFHYGKVAFAANTTYMLKTKLIPTLVAALAGLEVVVLFAIALRLLDYFQLFMQNAIGMVMPIFSQLEGRQEMDKLRRSFKIVNTFSVMFAMFVGLSIIFYGEIFIKLWMGEQYADSYKILFLLTIPFMVFLMQLPSRDVLYGVSKQKYYAWVNGVEVVLVGALSYILYPLLGIQGIALAVTIGITLPELALIYIAPKVIGMSPADHFMNMFMVMAASGALLITFYLTIRPLIEETYTSILYWGAIQTLYFVILANLIILPKDVKMLLFRSFGLEYMIYKTQEK